MMKNDLKEREGKKKERKRKRHKYLLIGNHE
jgi:hypothetical protein